MSTDRPLIASEISHHSPKTRAPNKHSEMVTRVFDIVIAAVLLVLLAPLIFAVSCAIWLENPRAPVIFRQTRYGRLGNPFVLYKLRTMVPNAESLKSDYAGLSVETGPGFKILDDPRVTKVGRFLRHSYIDEIPQLVNVLRGEMSVVGPRANSYEPSIYEPWQRERLSVKPGITGLWQITRNKPLDFDGRCKLDLEYIRNKSFLLDTTIFIRTFFVVLIRPAGY